MAVQKNFVVRNGLEVNNYLIFANSDSGKVGIASTAPNYTLDVDGTLGSVNAVVSGIITTNNIRINGTVSAGNSVGSLGQYLISTGTGVTWSSVSNARSIDIQTASVGIKTFSTNYTVGLLDVYVNGVKLSPSEFTATDSITVTLNDPCFGGENVEFVSYSSLGIGNAGIQGITVLDEGSIKGSSSQIRTLNFVGSGVTVTGVGNSLTVNVNAGSGLTVSTRDGIGGTNGNIVSNVSAIRFNGPPFNVTNLGNGEVLITSESTFKTWYVSGQPTIVASGDDYIELVAGPGIAITTKNTSSGVGTGEVKSVTITSTGGGGGTSDFVRTSAGIHTLGNVGIGTTNPVSVLSIGGTSGIFFTDSDIKVSISSITKTVTGIVTDYTVFNIIPSEANQTYTVNNLSGNLSGIGFTASFTRNNKGELAFSHSITNGGSGFVVNERIIVPGNLIGGSAPGDNLTVNVDAVSSGSVIAITYFATRVPSAANQSYTVSNLSGNLNGTGFQYSLTRNSNGSLSSWSASYTETKNFSLYEKIIVPGNLVGGISPDDDIKLSVVGIASSTYIEEGNIFIGQDVGQSNTIGCSNNFIGIFAGYSNTTGNNNNFFGNRSGYNNTTGSYNTFLGCTAGCSNTTGSNNFFVGQCAGYSNTTGSFNTFLGWTAGCSNTNGLNNNFFGSGAGVYSTTGCDNNFFGDGAGTFNTTGSRNNFFGLWSGYYHTTGQCNNAFGVQAGNCNLTGNKNIFLGNYTGVHTNTSYRVVIGEGTDSGTAFDVPKEADKQFAVGLNTDGNSQYWLVGDENFNIGIGTTNPTSKLTVIGSITASSFVGDGSGLTNLTTQPLQQRVVVTGVTTSIPNNGIGNTNITGFKSYALMKVGLSTAGWLRLYSDNASRTNDASRSIGIDPTPGSGVIAEVVTTGVSTSQIITPFTVGGNLDDPAGTTIYAAVTNLSGSTTTISINLTILKLEA